MSGRLRLVALVHGYPPAVGGVEFAVRDLCERLVADYGVSVTVLTTDAFTNANFRDASLPRISIVEGEVQNGVQVRRFPVDARWTLPLRIAQKLAWELRLPGNDRLRTWNQGPISPELAKAAATCEADVICAASFPLNHLRYAFLGRPPRPPVVLLGSIHPEDRWGYERPNLMGLAQQAFATVAHTEPEREWLLEHNAPAGRVVVIPEGVDPARRSGDGAAYRRGHGIAPSDLLVAFVGQQGSHKGIDLLLAALPTLVAAHPEARLLIAGGRTPYSTEVLAKVVRLPEPAQSRVAIQDDLPEGEKADLLAACDIFASPSRYESFGITTLEAWAARRPIVLVRGPATAWVVEEGVSGLLVPPQPDAVASALLRLAGDAGLRRPLGEGGRTRLLERFTLDRTVAAYHELFVAARAAAGPERSRASIESA